MRLLLVALYKYPYLLTYLLTYLVGYRLKIREGTRKC